jgi:hypothetical protein
VSGWFSSKLDVESTETFQLSLEKKIVSQNDDKAWAVVVSSKKREKGGDVQSIMMMRMSAGDKRGHLCRLGGRIDPGIDLRAKVTPLS